MAAAPRVDADTSTALRTHNCGELRMTHVGQKVNLAGWVQTARDLNHFAFVDLRDRYGITQVVYKNEGSEERKALYEKAKGLGREFVLHVEGTVVERENKNPNRPTGDIEIQGSKLTVLNASDTPPFLIQDETDAGELTRMKFRYCDIRRNPIKEALILRSKVARFVRNYLDDQQFIEIETPVLIKSTPEGARDFVVPSRMNPGQFYALPQSPQTFKQILMVAGMDRYFQIVKCFRDEELRADRQPEFTQIDCEMSFVEQEDVLNTFEGMIRALFKKFLNVDFPPFQRMDYQEAMEDYGIDKPDLRFGMKLKDLTEMSKGHNFPLFDNAEYVVAICIDGELVDEEAMDAWRAKQSKKKPPKKRAVDAQREKSKVKTWSKKTIKNLEKTVKGEAIAAKALVWVKVDDLEKGAFSSPAKKNFPTEVFQAWAKKCEAKNNDLICIFPGPKAKTQDAMGKFRNYIGDRTGLRKEGFSAHWVVDFPLLEWDEEEQRYNAMHHPFTAPKPEDVHLCEKDENGNYVKENIGKIRSNAYDMVINGVEVGGGSIRIHNTEMQHKMLELLGFNRKDAEELFGFLMNAFKYGAPPHGGLAFGLDRLCTIIGGGLGLNQQSIRDYIAFPKNNMGRDLMISAPGPIFDKQMEELKLRSTHVPAQESKE